MLTIRIGIAARDLSVGSLGVKSYLEGLLTSLLKIDEINEYYIFHISKDDLGSFPRANEVLLQSSYKLYWDYFQLPPAIKRYNIDVILFPKYVVPFFVNCKKILVIHDLGFYLPNKIYPLHDIIYIRLMLKSSIKRADHIITVSQNTKKDIVNILGLDENDITVTYLANNERYRKINEKKELNKVREKYDLNYPYIFNPSLCEPRKNVIRLLNAFKKIEMMVPHHLFITSKTSQRTNKLNKIIREYMQE